jgi:hypothetical protein
MAFGISPPKNITNIFGNWLHGLDKEIPKAKLEFMFLLYEMQYGMSNVFIFNKSKHASSLKVIPIAIHMTRTWSCLQLEELC